MSTVEALQQRIQALESMLEADAERKRKKLKEIFTISSESNPYSGLLALEKFGIIGNYQLIREATVAIVGVGGTGSWSAEMLTRCGIGKLILIDFDDVKIEHLIKNFFQPHHIGLPKVKAVEEALKDLNPEVDIEIYKYAISQDNLNRFKEILNNNGCSGKSVDLVVSSVKNSDMNLIINSVCTECDLIWFETEIAKTAISGHIQCIIPGRTACWVCASPMLRGLKDDEEDLTADFPYKANLPTTISVIAGILVQNILKVLLRFGKVSHYIQYSALIDFFPSVVLDPNSECSEQFCKLRQHEYGNIGKSRPNRNRILRKDSSLTEFYSSDSQEKLKSN